MNNPAFKEILKTDSQVCALREYAMARQAMQRAADELQAALGLSDLTDDHVETLSWALMNKDPREVDHNTLSHVMAAISG